MMQYLQQGHISPIQPIEDFSAHDVIDAFRFMQKGQHIGKIVVTMPEEVKQLASIHTLRQHTFSDRLTYLLIGGLGGLGKAVASWMVENGARSLVFFSPSAGKSIVDQQFLQELQSQGCHAVAVAGSAAEMKDVEKAIKAAPTPINGVIQMSMVLRVSLGIFLAYIKRRGISITDSLDCSLGWPYS